MYYYLSTFRSEAFSNVIDGVFNGSLTVSDVIKLSAGVDVFLAAVGGVVIGIIVYWLSKGGSSSKLGG